MVTFSSFLAAFHRAKIRRSAIRSLRSLSSEQLADLGIAPDGIGDVVDGLIARQATSSVRKQTGSVAVVAGMHSLSAAH